MNNNKYENARNKLLVAIATKKATAADFELAYKTMGMTIDFIAAVSTFYARDLTEADVKDWKEVSQ